MLLPDYVRRCVDALESAGFAAYAVGGCVRDACLGLTPQDYDLCTSALPEETERVFSGHRLVLAGKKHGTVAVVTEGGIVEITTFRTEGDYTDSRHPGWVRFVPDIEADLARRDFTVNAMAFSPSRGFADPFGGRADLEHRVLRAVGDPATRFEEDALRILRGVRFAVKYGLTVEEKTMDAMLRLAPTMDKLARERVFEELCKLLVLVTPEDLLRFAPILASVIPELGPMIGFDQRSPHHAYDLFTHTARVCGNLPPTLTLRWAGLLHDTGKIPTFTQDETGRGHFYGHAKASAQMADDILRRLKAPTALREEVTGLIELHMTKLPPEKKVLRRWLGRLGPEAMDTLLTFQQADFGGKGTGLPEEAEEFPRLRVIVGEIQAENACLSLKDLAVNGRDLMDLGFEGKAIGACLQRLLDLVIDEKIPNERDALLAEAGRSAQ
ncbi:MAG: HD domain-containing protein [Oscillospiraceae bacterium]|nr:HD domain-containing protein [Oscillospiraceae bacterium]